MENPGAENHADVFARHPSLLGDFEIVGHDRRARPTRSMNTTWLFVAALRRDSFSLLATTESLLLRRTPLLDVVGAIGAHLLSKGPGIAFAIRASAAVFGANEFGVRFLSPVLAAATSLLLFYFARRLRRHRWSVGGHRFECHAHFQHRRGRDDDRCAVDDLDGGNIFTFWLAG